MKEVRFNERHDIKFIYFFSIKETSNIAYQKDTDQSSTKNEKYGSSNAVDGDRNGRMDAFSCSHTRSDDTVQWWNVDFGAEAKVKSVQITNRADCCRERLGDFDILVGSNGPENRKRNQICGSSLDMTGVAEKKFECQKDVVGKYLYICSKLNVALSLCEVQVFGVLLPVKSLPVDSC